jgi:hypothetical protein
MVGREYLLQRKPPPRSVKLAVDQVLIPAAIDTAAQLEALAEIVATTARRWPWRVVGGAFALGWAAGRLRGRKGLLF